MTLVEDCHQALIAPGDPKVDTEHIMALFEERHGRSPSVVSSAPGRVNLMGEHTDYNGGLCLPIALPHSTYVAAAARDDRQLSIYSAQAGEAFRIDLNQLSPETAARMACVRGRGAVGPIGDRPVIAWNGLGR